MNKEDKKSLKDELKHHFTEDQMKSVHKSYERKIQDCDVEGKCELCKKLKKRMKIIQDIVGDVQND